MFARSEGSLRPRHSFLIISQALKRRGLRSPSIKGFSSFHRCAWTLFERPQSALSKLRAASGALPRCSRPLEQLRRTPKRASHSAQTRISRSPIVHPHSQPVQRFNKRQFPSCSRASHINLNSAILTIIRSSSSQTGWSCRFFVPASYSSSAPVRPSPGQLQNRLPTKVPSRSLGLNTPLPGLSRRPGTNFNSVGRFFRRAPLPPQGSAKALALCLRPIGQGSEQRGRRPERRCWMEGWWWGRRRGDGRRRCRKRLE